MHLELVTLTETSVVLTWFTGDPTAPDEFGRPEPIPADTIVLLGTSPASLATAVERDDGTPYHYVELTGLQPGQQYFYQCRSNGLPATPTSAAPEPAATGTFTTPLPPPGRHLFTMAWANDLHLGEGTSGSATGAVPGGFPPGFAADPANPYWRFMATAAVAESRARGAELMLVCGDLTSEARPPEVAEARSILDGFGTYRDDYYVIRGNHDRVHSGPTWQDCGPVTGGNDCLRDEFFPESASYFAVDRFGVHFVGLDTVDAAGNGGIDATQFDWLAEDLKANSGRPTFVFGHHPVTEVASATAVPPVVFTLPQADASKLESLLADSSTVGVYNAHTHRNKRTTSLRSGALPYVELGAVKEYPGGFGIVRVHEGGYAVNFYKTKAEPARAWSERSRGEYLGLYPYYTLGNTSDRNFVIEADFSDAARGVPTTAPSSEPSPGSGSGTGGSGGGGALPSTGNDGSVAAIALAAAAVGAGAAYLRRDA
jgi:hypothetical protein